MARDLLTRVQSTVSRTYFTCFVILRKLMSFKCRYLNNILKNLSHLHRNQPILLVDCIQNFFVVLTYLFRNMCRDMQTGMLSKVYLRRTVGCLWQVLVQTVWQRQKVGLHLQKGEGRCSSNPTPATGWPESEDNYPQIQPGEGWPGCIQSK